MPDPHAAQREFDFGVAETVERVDGGWVMLTPEYSRSWELNKVLLEPGASADVVERALALCEERFDGFAHRRVCIPAPGEDIVAPSGWKVEDLLVMEWRGEPPAWPEDVREIDVDTIYAARVAGGMSPADARLQLPFGRAAASRPLAIFEDGEIGGWCEVHEGSIDDVWVLEPRRGRGLGRRLTQAGLAAGGWFLLCDRDDPLPQGLYRSLGFVETGRVLNLTRHTA